MSLFWQRLRATFLRFSACPRLILIVVVIASLAPFLNKAVNIDDPLFLWSAKWIQAHPGDFYGSSVNWFGVERSMAVSNYNPPLTSYLQAGIGSVLGWHEIFLHGVFALVAIIGVLGVYELARLWCQRPLVAALIAWFSPAFLVSSTTLMCDLPAFSLWIWSVVLWERALQCRRLALLFWAGVLLGVAILTKYSAITLLPLLFVLGVLRERRLGWWLLALVLPLLMLAGYEVYSAQIYHRGLFSLAREYAAENASVFPGGLWSKYLVGAVFLGGCTLPVLFFAPFLWLSRRIVLVGIISIVLLFTGLSDLGQIGPLRLLDGQSNAFLLLQITILATAGVHVLALTACEWWQQRDPTTTGLAVWVFSGLCFSVLLNWTISARSFLPFIPAIAILVTRRWERLRPTSAVKPLIALIPAAAVALCVALADYSFANAARFAARDLSNKYSLTGQPLWFQGHWGFQYYMQAEGGLAVDYERSTLPAGASLVVPANGCNTMYPPEAAVAETVIFDYPICSWLGTMQSGKSGFHAADWGPLPFAFGAIPPERYYVFKLAQAVRFRSPQTDLGSAVAVDGAPVVVSNTAAPVGNFARMALAAEQSGQSSEAISLYRKALVQAPDDILVLNNLAWLLAVNADSRLRDGPAAVHLALRASALDTSQQPIILGTLAAAYAEAGRFPEAVVTAQKAIDLATAAGLNEIAARNIQLQELYRAGQPYHEPAR
ncbi:MAG: glycosyltransferase family 39 protein [Verrucomicrobiota bacterium]